MITQGWPLWAVRRATGQVYAVVGWDDGLRAVTGPTPLAIVVEIGVELDGPPAALLGSGVRFVSDYETVLRLTR